MAAAARPSAWTPARRRLLLAGTDVFDDEDRRAFVESLSSVVRNGGRYFMLCFSDEEPAGWGPRRITQAEIREAFADGWDVERIEPAELDVTIRPEPVRAWFATISRT